MSKNKVHLRQSIRSESAANYYCYEDMIERDNTFKLVFVSTNLERRLERDEVIEIRTQPGMEGQYCHPMKELHNKRKIDSISSRKSYYSNKIESIKTHRKQMEIKINKLKGKINQQNQKINQKSELIMKQKQKITLLECGIEDQNFQIVVNEQKLAKLSQLEKTPEIIEERRKANKNISRGQTKIEKLKNAIKIKEKNIKSMEYQMEKLEDLQRSFLNQYKQLEKILDFYTEDQIKRLKRKIPGYDQLKEANKF